MRKWDLFYELVRTDFVMRYHNSVLGFIWVLLKPFLLFLIIVTVFSFIFKSQDPNYSLNLLLGLLIYSYFSEGTLRGVTSLYDRSTVILKVNFPKIIAVYTTVANSFISFLAGLGVFWVFLLISGKSIYWYSLVYFLVWVIILSALILAINLFTGIIYIKLRDWLSIWEVALQLLFWATPIVYPLSVLPEPWRRIALLNPLGAIISYSRTALIGGESYHWQAPVYVLGPTAVLLLLGLRFFSKEIKKVAENF